MTAFHDLTEKERAFRALISGVEVYPGRIDVNPDYSAWAAKVRARWEREHILWFHGYHRGRAIWRPEKPPPDPDAEQTPRCKSRSSIGDDPR